MDCRIIAIFSCLNLVNSKNIPDLYVRLCSFFLCIACNFVDAKTVPLISFLLSTLPETPLVAVIL